MINIVLFALIAISRTMAQSIPACALACATPVCIAGAADIACFCQPTNIAAIGACVATGCTAPSDLAQATSLAVLICPALTNNPTNNPALNGTVANGSGVATSITQPSITITTFSEPAGFTSSPSGINSPTTGFSGKGSGLDTTSTTGASTDAAKIWAPTTSSSSTSSRLGTGAIVGIVAGILGGCLIMSVLIIFYLIHKNRGNRQNALDMNVEPTAAETQLPEKPSKNLQPINDQINEIPDGGRLRYPNETVEASGRLKYPTQSS